MHIGILSARGSDYYPNQRLLEASSHLGHKAHLIHPKTCRPALGDARFSIPGSGNRPDTLLTRIGATINDYALALVRHFERCGVRTVNGFESIAVTRNKFLSLQTLCAKGIPVPRSFLVSNPPNFELAAQDLGGYPVVVKDLCSRQGNGVFLVERPSEGARLVETLDARNRGILVQEFLPPIDRLDVRALVLGKRVAAALALTPRKGDFRANIHQHGQARPMVPDETVAGLALRAATALRLEIAGVDMIIDQRGQANVIEVNYSPGFRGLETVSGLDIAGEIIQHAEQVFRHKPGVTP